jgi:DNA-binding transcriptional regulator PaaX
MRFWHLIDSANAQFSLYQIISTRKNEMLNKEMLSSTLPLIQDISQKKSNLPEDNLPKNWPGALKKIWLYLKGENTKKISAPDHAAAIISQIENKEVAGIVRDLHYMTPKSLKAMREACEQCFVLPDDCPYYDYSIFDVKKAIKRLEVHPKHTHSQVAKELKKINHELAHHISDYME